MARDAGGGVASRTAVFFVVWLAVAGWAPKDALLGAAVAAAAGLVSRVLCPRFGFRIRPGALARLARGFFSGSAAAGLDVARRALGPDMRLKPGFLAFDFSIPPGPARSAFSALSSLQPGTLPTGGVGDGLAIHALDTTQPVRATLAADEALFMRAFGQEPGQGARP